jgi:hypothetical protein
MSAPDPLPGLENRELSVGCDDLSVVGYPEKDRRINEVWPPDSYRVNEKNARNTPSESGLFFVFRWFIHRFVELFFNLILSFFELLDAFAKPFGQLGQLLRAEKEKNDEQNENEFLAA